jgi:uncharacterized delta-60 repeat protein
MKRLLLSFSLLIYFATTNSQPGSPDLSFGMNGKVFTDFGANVNLLPNECRKILPLSDGSFYLVVSSSQAAYVTHRLEDGSLDIKYGLNGYSTLSIIPRSAALQPDGKIVLAQGYGDFILVRLKVDGSLDSSFSSDGNVRTNFPGVNGDGYDDLTSLAVQPDGKIIAAGSSDYRFAIARYLPDGTLDSSFSADGLFAADFSTQMASVSAIAIQGDGSIIAAGSCLISSVYTVAVFRLLKNGTPDNSFSSNGFETIDPVVQSASAIGAESDNKIVIGGTFKTGGNSQFGVIRLLTNGDLDNSFSDDGLQTISFAQAFGTLEDMALQPDGKIVAAGLVWEAGGYTHFGTARLNADGSLDNSFGHDGTIITQVGPSRDNVYSAALNLNGKILVAGSAYISLNYQFAVVKYNSNGTLDNSFDADGILLGFKPSFSTSFNSSAVQQDGKLVVVGYAMAKAWWTDTYEAEMAVVRYNVDGTLDKTFSDDGKLIIDYGTGAGTATSVVIQKDGKIIIGGTVSIGSYNDFAVVRLNPDGSFDNTFSGDGKLLTDFGNTEDQCLSIAIQKDGKIVAAGYTIEYGTQRAEDIAIARYNVDGSLDNTFSGDGKLVSDFISKEGVSTMNTANKVFIQEDGKIVVTGQYALWDVYFGFMMVRYLAEGELDRSFNGTGMVITNSGGSSTSALQADGKIVVAGFGAANSGYFTVARYNANGTLDSSFSSAGILNDGINEASAIAIQPDGKLIFGGASYDHMLLWRYNPDGSLDNSFGNNGRVVDPAAGRITGLAISGNRIFAVGSNTSEGTIGFVAAYQMGCSINVSIADAMALPVGVDPNTVYIGYGPASAIVLRAHTPPGQYVYRWSNGATTSSIRVSPVLTTTYSVTISNQLGCSANGTKLINVKDIRCGNKMDNVTVCQHSKWSAVQAKTICVSPYLVPAFLYGGSYLGACTDELVTEPALTNNDIENNTLTSGIQVYPNPTNAAFTVIARVNSKEKIIINVYDASGRKIEKKQIFANEFIVIGSAYKPGIYYMESLIGNAMIKTKLIKQ